MNTTSRLIRFFLLLMLVVILPTTSASAALTRCRTDPIFKLSNGDIVTVAVEVGTDVANIRNIHYILHVPPGVTVKQVTYTAGDRIAAKETYVVRQDSPAKTYVIDTFVTTQDLAKVDVIVYTRLNGGVRKTVTGYSGQHLFSTLIRP